MVLNPLKPPQPTFVGNFNTSLSIASCEELSSFKGGLWWLNIGGGNSLLSVEQEEEQGDGSWEFRRSVNGWNVYHSFPL